MRCGMSADKAATSAPASAQLEMVGGDGADMLQIKASRVRTG
jgi:hypothetical protein